MEFPKIVQSRMEALVKELIEIKDGKNTNVTSGVGEIVIEGKPRQVQLKIVSDQRSWIEKDEIKHTKYQIDKTVN